MFTGLRIAGVVSAATMLCQGTLLATSLTIDDFGGGPHLVNLVSLVPPQLVTGSFLYGGAVGGVRDVFVLSQSVGIFASGFSFGSGGYSSYTGTGQGGIVWDGSNAGAVDANSDGFIDPGDFEYGLNLDTVGGCVNPLLRLQAFTDQPGAEVFLFLGNSASDYALYQINLTTIGSFDDYFASILSPTVSVGSFDPTVVKTVALMADVNVIANLLSVECGTSVPDAASSMVMMGLGLVALGGARRFIRG